VNRPALRARRGFTLLEMILSMTLMMAFLGMTAELFRKQSGSVSASAGRLDAQQNLRFATSSIERELRMAGLGIADAQPLLVQATATAITFNADLIALDTGDYNAVYINPDADSAAVDVLRPTSKITLPNSTSTYPDSLYTYSGAPSGVPSYAETISYWISHDSTSAYSNEYIMFRRVNARPVRVIARGIRYNGDGDSPFRFFVTTDTSNNEVIPPFVHTAAIHGSPADTGKSAMTDSITSVWVSLRSAVRDLRSKSTGDTAMRSVSIKVHLMNAGLVHHSSCGQAPLGVTPTATLTPISLPTIPAPFVTITWPASVDDGSGEKDVVRYAVYRHLAGAAVFDEPIASVPAGTYTFKDTDVTSGQTWVYGVAVQDCTPALSPIGTAPPVAIP
jgi:hypothetical protein